MLNRETLAARFHALPLSPDHCWLTAGGAMVLYGLRRETRDLDVGCDTALADQLEAAGYPVHPGPEGNRRIDLAQDVDLSENFGGGAVRRIDGVPVVSLEEILALKLRLNREKDQPDIAALRAALAGGASAPL